MSPNDRLATSYRHATGPWRGPKFPYAVILDDDGQPTGEELLPQDYKPEQHKGHIGCPDCFAKLKGVVQKVVRGRVKETPHIFFSSINLDEHPKTCDLASPDDRVRRAAHDRLAFFKKEGPKLLYLDFVRPLNNLKLDPKYKSPESISDTSGYKTGMQEGDVATYRVRSAKELLKFSKHKDFSDSFYNDVFIYVNEHRIPWRSVMMGVSQAGLLKNTYNDVANHFFSPKFSILTLQKDVLPLPDSKGFFRIECEAQSFTDKKDPSKIRQFLAQPIIGTNNKEVLEVLKEGGTFLVYAVPTVQIEELHSISGRLREKASNNNVLPVYIQVNNPQDIVNCEKYLNGRQEKKVIKIPLNHFTEHSQIPLSLD